MKHLAALIREGLRSGVKEDPLIWGAGQIGDHIEANIIGLALIGKVGLQVACQLFELALSETLNGDQNCPAVKKVLDELSIDEGTSEQLVVAHASGESAEHVAQMIESGELTIKEY